MSFSASGVQSAYERVRWAEGVAPKDADLSKVYVFDAKSLTPDLTEIQAWLDGFGPNRLNSDSINPSGSSEKFMGKRWLREFPK